ncbi:MAG TPA: pyridoxal-phosphate dependent enzyme, partial [Spirochaetota bacterium]|nr:pyridoxal-phosphate dependent enzyme [Spirochaetota bacterium]
LKQIFGDAVHCFFVEPLESPCVLLGLLTGFTRPVSVYDVGLSNKTDADGLAVAAPSMLAGRLVAQHVAGCITVPDEELYRMLYMLHTSEGMQVEPSAAAGLYGYTILSSTDPGKKYLEDMHIPGKTATHIAWTTGGRFLPPSEFQIMLARGKNQ